ncbi:hypothetical protein [Paraburkholderia sp. RL18-085-BIA-A]|uniref:hypothetical protein n=1 Tax=Paraburkholderia sp. RL18-085-BIA-A TaxID=3031633 RepID=UPI0038B97251
MSYLTLATHRPVRTSFRLIQRLFKPSVQHNDVSPIFWQVGSGQMPAASEAFEMLRARVNGKRIETESIGCRMEAVGLCGEKSQGGFVTFFSLNALEFTHNWSLRTARFNQLRDSRGFVRTEDVSPSIG